MSGQVREAREVIAEVHWAFLDTREGRHCCVPVGVTAQHVRCPRDISRLHAPEYTPDPAHVVDWGEIEVDTDGTFEEGLVCILDSVVRFCDARP